jgi:hypothetical protein
MEAVNVRHQRELEAAATREEQLHQKVRLLSFVDLKNIFFVNWSWSCVLQST